MRLSKTQPLPVLLAALVLVGGANLAAHAATGDPLLAGRTTLATKATTLQNTGNGPALSLRTKPTVPPLAVTSKRKVARLNADQLDGLEGQALQNKAVAYTLTGYPSASIVAWSLPAVPEGDHLVSGLISFDTPGGVRCAVSDNGTDVLAASTTAVGGRAEVVLHGYVEAGGALRVTCSGTSSLTMPWTTYDSTVTFTRLDLVTAKLGSNVTP